MEEPVLFDNAPVSPELDVVPVRPVAAAEDDAPKPAAVAELLLIEGHQSVS